MGNLPKHHGGMREGELCTQTGAPRLASRGRSPQGEGGQRIVSGEPLDTEGQIRHKGHQFSAAPEEFSYSNWQELRPKDGAAHASSTTRGDCQGMGLGELLVNK